MLRLFTFFKVVLCTLVFLSVVPQQKVFAGEREAKLTRGQEFRKDVTELFSIINILVGVSGRVAYNSVDKDFWNNKRLAGEIAETLSGRTKMLAGVLCYNYLLPYVRVEGFSSFKKCILTSIYQKSYHYSKKYYLSERDCMLGVVGSVLSETLDYYSELEEFISKYDIKCLPDLDDRQINLEIKHFEKLTKQDEFKSMHSQIQRIYLEFVAYIKEKYSGSKEVMVSGSLLKFICLKEKRMIVSSYKRGLNIRTGWVETVH